MHHRPSPAERDTHPQAPLPLEGSTPLLFGPHGAPKLTWLVFGKGSNHVETFLLRFPCGPFGGGGYQFSDSTVELFFHHLARPALRVPQWLRTDL